MKYSSVLNGLFRIVSDKEKKEIKDYLSGDINDSFINKKLEEKEKKMIFELSHGRGEWWKSLFPQERAYMQYNCNVLILPLTMYISDMEILLHRKINMVKLYNCFGSEFEINFKFEKWLQNVEEDY